MYPVAVGWLRARFASGSEASLLLLRHARAEEEARREEAEARSAAKPECQPIKQKFHFPRFAPLLLRAEETQKRALPEARQEAEARSAAAESGQGIFLFTQLKARFFASRAWRSPEEANRAHLVWAVNILKKMKINLFATRPLCCHDSFRFCVAVAALPRFFWLRLPRSAKAGQRSQKRSAEQNAGNAVRE